METIEKILTTLDDRQGKNIDLATIGKIRDLFEVDQIAGREIYVDQLSKGSSLWFLLGGLVALSASIFTAKELMVTYGKNPMEIVNVVSLVAWLASTLLLFSFTWSKKKETDPLGANGIMSEAPEDVKVQLR